MYGLNEIVAMNAFPESCHKKRVSSEHLSGYNRFARWWARDFLDDSLSQITDWEWEARQQKELEVHIDANNQHEGE
jgi:hypothetical protein